MLQNDMYKVYQTALNLERTIIDDAEKKAEKLISEAQAAEKEAISSAAESARLDAEQYEHRQRAKILAEYSNMVTEHTANCRTQLLKKREEIQNAVFDRLRKKIIEFTASDEYAEFLKRTLLSLENGELSGKSDGIEIIISKNPADKTAALGSFSPRVLTLDMLVVMRVFALDEKQLAYASAVNDFLSHNKCRSTAADLTYHQHFAGFPLYAHHLLTLTHIQRHRLFTQYMLAGTQKRRGHFKMKLIGGYNNNRIDII